MDLALVKLIWAAPPQLKVMLPPPTRAAVSAASVQLAGVPVPTTPAARAGDAGEITHRVTIREARSTTRNGLFIVLSWSKGCLVRSCSMRRSNVSIHERGNDDRVENGWVDPVAPLTASRLEPE